MDPGRSPERRFSNMMAFFIVFQLLARPLHRIIEEWKLRHFRILQREI